MLTREYDAVVLLMSNGRKLEGEESHDVTRVSMSRYCVMRQTPVLSFL